MTRPATPKRWLLGGILCVLAAGALFVRGALSGFARAGKLCAIEAGRGPSDLPDEVRQRLIPLSHTCQWRDGTSVDLVPGWLNPALAACLLAAVVCALMLVRSIRNPIRNPHEESA
ncbi:hypothetical protein [Kitasatospora sp. SUK 42]|uniref:hypothetical protein n=1 Tax=Kitasatospora sp. SUK 42 TaxID=1588882 RepID=UPI001C315B80|nr:hypothetical protein [Kitasatospora sp. SUK 42]MBV2156554.1 hypothetical protein [Kitasatospora sp. SUK 42]